MPRSVREPLAAPAAAPITAPSSGWNVVRDRAVDKVAADFSWTVIERGQRPLLDTGSCLLCVVHPLDAVDDQLAGGVPTQYGTALPFDCFNFDRRPGEVFRQI